MTTEQLLAWVVVAAIQSSLLIVAVLFLRKPVTRWLGARWAYYLWLVPFLGLLGSLFPRQLFQQVFGISPLGVPAAKEVFNAASTASDTVLLVWASGLLLTLGWFAACSIRFSICTRLSSRELTFEERIEVRWRCARLARRIEVDFRLLSTAEGPAVAGLFQPVLLLPSDFFCRYSEQQQALMLLHELEHLSRRDLVALFLARVYRCLFWFNPLAWIAEHALRFDQELSCDERVVSLEAPATRRLYGETMLLATHAQLASSQAGYPTPFSQLRQRTAMLRHHRSNLAASACGVMLLVSAIGAGAVFGALGTVEPSQDAREAMALIEKAEAMYAGGDYVESLQALVRAESLDPRQYAPSTWALRGFALAKGKEWEQAEECFARAIRGAKVGGTNTELRWFLAEAVMKLNLGDVEGATRSLHAAKEQFRGTPFEVIISEFDRLLQENWDPQKGENLLAQF